ncbi:MAG: hypothetical protein AB1480_08300 [Nitrospirota bacterium]
MDTIEKLRVLSEDSKYDLACACGTGKDEHRRRGTEGRWIYPVPLQQGGYTVLLKTLLSNACVNDCKYCPLRSETNVRRCTLKLLISPSEKGFRWEYLFPESVQWSIYFLWNCLKMVGASVEVRIATRTMLSIR